MHQHQGHALPVESILRACSSLEFGGFGQPELVCSSVPSHVTHENAVRLRTIPYFYFYNAITRLTHTGVTIYRADQKTFAREVCLHYGHRAIPAEISWDIIEDVREEPLEDGRVRIVFAFTERSSKTHEGLAALLSGFVLDVANAETAEGILEGVRLMSTETREEKILVLKQMISEPIPKRPNYVQDPKVTASVERELRNIRDKEAAIRADIMHVPTEPLMAARPPIVNSEVTSKGGILLDRGDSQGTMTRIIEVDGSALYPHSVAQQMADDKIAREVLSLEKPQPKFISKTPNTLESFALASDVSDLLRQLEREELEGIRQASAQRQRFGFLRQAPSIQPTADTATAPEQTSTDSPTPKPTRVATADTLNETRVSQEEAATDKMAAQLVPGEGWKAVTHHPSGKTYYVNKIQNRTTWKISETQTLSSPTITAANPLSQTDSNPEKDVADAKTAPPPPPTKAPPPPPTKAPPPAPPTSFAAADPLSQTDSNPEKDVADAKAAPPPPPTKAPPPPPTKAPPPAPPTSFAAANPLSQTDSNPEKDVADAKAAPPPPTKAPPPPPTKAPPPPPTKAPPPPPTKAPPPPPTKAPPPPPTKAPPPAPPTSTLEQDAPKALVQDGAESLATVNDSGNASTSAKKPVGGKIYGSFKEMVDPKTGRNYYCNLSTKEVKWAMPPEVAKLKATESSQEAMKIEAPSVQILPDGLRVCGVWRERRTAEGKHYYVNTETKTSTWKISETPFAL